MIQAILPAYTLNEEIQKVTEEAIKSIGDVPLVVVDNASPMGGGWLRSQATTYVRNSQNLGFAKAVNQGIKLATTRYVAVVSNDIVASPNWQEVALEVLSDASTFSCHFRMINYGRPFAYGDEVSYTGRERWCTAAFFVLDREKGLFFDEDFFNSFEDYDLLLRARKLGYENAYTSKACFQHHHSFTQRFTGFKGTDQNKELFKKKHGEYADILFAKEFPEQMEKGYWEGFDL